MPEPREGNLVGIDPVAFKAMNTDLAKVKALIDSNLPKLRTAFAKVELQTGRIERLAAVSRWIDSEMPMLQRRQLLAQQLQKEALQLGLSQPMVSRDSTGNFSTTEAAVARAKALAAQYKNGELPSEAWNELSLNQHDPDFAEAFVKAIGPDAAKLLAASSGSPEAWDGGKDKDAARHYTALANLFATASHRGVINDDWLDKFPGMIGLMRQGTWDNAVLVHVGQRALDSMQLTAGNNYRTAEILKIIARSPIAATQLYESRFDKIQQMVRGEAFGWTATSDPALGDPLGEFITAATVTARPLYEGLRTSRLSRNPAEELTRQLLFDFKAHSERTKFDGVLSAYANIATAYMDDLFASVAAPTVPEYFNNRDPLRPGIEVPAALWNVLAQQAMADPKNAAYLSQVFHTKYAEVRSEVGRHVFKKDPVADEYSLRQIGRLAGWFVQALKGAIGTNQEEVAAYNKKLAEVVDKLADPTNAAVLAAGGGVGAAAAAAGNSVLGMFKSMALDDVKRLIVGWLDETPKTYPTDTKDWVGESKTWQDEAQRSFKDRRIEPVTEESGKVWTGDPAYYEKLYGARFTNGIDELEFEEPRSMSQAALRAYAAWLQDPAVQQATYGNFIALRGGVTSDG